MLENKKIVFIVNPISGVGKKDMLPEVVDKYINGETNEIEIILTEYAGHAFKIAKQKADEGVVTFENKEVDFSKKLNKKDIADIRKDTAFVFQTYNLFFNKTRGSSHL